MNFYSGVNFFLFGRFAAFYLVGLTEALTLLALSSSLPNVLVACGVPAGGLGVTGLTLSGGSSLFGLMGAPVASFGMFFGAVADIFFFSTIDYPIVVV
jgi:hypothetical protein